MFGSSYKEYSPFQTDVELGYDSSFGNGDARRGFLRKVFGILSLQLLLTACIGGFIIGVKSLRNWMFTNIWVFYLVMAASFVFLIVLVCSPDLKNRHPHNLILLFSFTACEGVLVGTISATYDINAVVLAAVITTGVTIGLTLFALQTKIDFTMFSGILFACLLALCLTSFILMFVPRNKIFSTIFAGAGALLFSVYLVYDVQLIAGGRKEELNLDDYVPAALTVYLDIINLFLFILRMLNSRN